MTQRLPTFSVVIPTFDRAEVVETTLRHLRAQTYPAGRYEIIIVDNSRDDTPEMVRRVAIRCAERRTAAWG